MKKYYKFAFPILAIMTLVDFSSLAIAQSYSTIDGSLSFYCADLPDGTNAVVKIDNANGQYNVTPVDPKAAIESILKLRKSIQKRINALSQIKKDYDPSTDLSKIKSIFKFVTGEIADGVEASDSLDKTKPHNIYKKISEMISMLKLRLEDLKFALEAIDRCVKGEDLIPSPHSAVSEVISFPFTHPDYGSLEVMRGLGATAILHKKRIMGSLCVSFEKAHISIAKFPKESEVRLVRNPCIFYFQSTFRNYPFCHYGSHVDQAVAWFGSTNFGFSQSVFDDKERASLEKKLAGYGKITLRAPTKKKPCRTK